MKTALYIKDVNPEHRGIQKLYKLTPPLQRHRFVVVSVATDYFTCEPEAYVFPSNKNGEIRVWGELKGSTRGTARHSTALKNAGYIIKRK